MPQNSVNIRIRTETWKRMQELKDEPGKTWDDVINQLLDEAGEAPESNEGNGEPTAAD